MNINITLRHGPLDIEVDADDEEEYLEETLAIAEFLEENEETLETLEIPTTNGATAIGGMEESSRVKVDGDDTSSSDNGETSLEAGTDDSENTGPLAPIAEETGIPVPELEHLLVAAPEADRPPELLLNELDILGKQEVEKKRAAALILLFVYHRCYGEERVSSSDLKDSFLRSDIPEEHINQAYHDEGKRLFDPTGRGGSASVALLGPGERAAVKEIKRVIGEMDI